MTNTPHSCTFTSTPPLGHCPCDVIHIYLKSLLKKKIAGREQGGGVTTAPPGSAPGLGLYHSQQFIAYRGVILFESLFTAAAGRAEENILYCLSQVTAIRGQDQGAAYLVSARGSRPYICFFVDLRRASWWHSGYSSFLPPPPPQGRCYSRTSDGREGRSSGPWSNTVGL